MKLRHGACLGVSVWTCAACACALSVGGCSQDATSGTGIFQGNQGLPIEGGAPPSGYDGGNAPRLPFEASIDDVGSGPPMFGPRPDFGSTVSQAVAPPAISGGTLFVAKDGHTALAADPDRDSVYIVDTTSSLVRTVALQPGDEPGRGVEDANGQVHFALRHGGAVVTISLATGSVLARRAVCAAPRGIAYEAATGNLHVACSGGELVSMPASGNAPISRTLHLPDDLRDVVVVGSELYVSRFRTAQLLEIAADGTLVSTQAPAQAGDMAPGMAWRLISVGPGTLAMVHQRARLGLVSTQPGGYGDGNGCESGIVESTITLFQLGATGPRIAGGTIPAAVLPVDLAVTADGNMFALVAAGNGKTSGLSQVMTLFASDLAAQSAPPGADAGAPCVQTAQSAAAAPEPTAVAYDGQGRMLVQTREPAALITPQSTISLSSVSREDTGHAIFHSNAGGFMACASCHGEGGEDGHTWTFDNATSPRRTQALRGTLAGTAPYHWEGDQADIAALAHEVFVTRMSGAELAPDQVGALEKWLFALPRPAMSPPASAASVVSGMGLFNSAAVGCASCHTGAKYTNNATLDVGTGGLFQVPSLVGVGARSPYLHDGRAARLEDRFDPSLGGGDKHGHTSQLTAGQIGDLVAFLKTL